VICPGSQGDVSVHGHLLFVSVEVSGRVDCSTSTSAPEFRGIRIFDISDVENPQHVAGVYTCRGSHTHTVVPSTTDDVVYVYVSGTQGARSTGPLTGCTNSLVPNSSRYKADVIEVPLDAPEDARIVADARLMADPDSGAINGLWPGGDHGPGTQRTPETDACHDLTAYPEIGLAAGACEGNGILIDISDPVNPRRVD